MKTYVRDMWADALESGEYEQGFRALASPLKDEYGDPTDKVGYCCLGVLCDLYAKETDRPDAWRLEGLPADDTGATTYAWVSGNDERTFGVLPVGVMAWAGLTSIDPELRDEDGVPQRATIWNDEARRSFPEIAAMVRSLPGDDA